MATRNLIPVETLRRLLRCDDEGRLFWLPRTDELFNETAGRTAAHACANWNAKWAGREAFTAVSAQGYRFGNLLGRPQLAHRVVFALCNGYWSAEHVDHVNRNRLDNRPDNLRAATRGENTRNGSSHRDSTSRFRGVSWCSGEGNWRAQCMDSTGRNRMLGRYADEAAAAKAYDRAALEWHGDFAGLNFPQVGAL